MIKILKVTGGALVMDGFTSTIPTVGMQFDNSSPNRTFIFITGPVGSMEIDLNNKKYRIQNSTANRIRGGKPPEEVKTKGNIHEIKILLGKIWGMVASDQSWEVVTGNAVIGVRG